MPSVKVLVMLFGICLLAINTSAIKHGCCTKYMTGRLPFVKIKGYSVQTVNEMCPINAIIFHTNMGKACTNPSLDWVMKYIDRLRIKAQRVHMNTAQAPQ
eukprot:superscaffoldBa00001466_g10684